MLGVVNRDLSLVSTILDFVLAVRILKTGFTKYSVYEEGGWLGEVRYP